MQYLMEGLSLTQEATIPQRSYSQLSSTAYLERKRVSRAAGETRPVPRAGCGQQADPPSARWFLRPKPKPTHVPTGAKGTYGLSGRAA